MFLGSSATHPELTRLLEQAKLHQMTPAEIREQRISFVYGQMMDCAPEITREQVARRVDELDRNCGL